MAGIVRLDPGTTKNREGRTFPFSSLPELRDVLEEQRAASTILERETGAIVPWVFHRAASPSKFYRRSWLRAARRAVHAASRTTSDARPFAIWSALVCRSAWR